MKTFFKWYMAISILFTIYSNFELGFWSVIGNLVVCVVPLAIVAIIYSGFANTSNSYPNQSSYQTSRNYSQSRQTQNSKPQKRYYSCPRCGQTLDYPGTCGGRCGGDGRGVFRM